LPFDDAVYGLGAGIFFIGYFLFEVPSNLLLERIGARKTLLRIMVLWGLAATAMMFVSTPLQFYVVRFLLGAFEAGFFPGVILYFTYWLSIGAARSGDCDLHVGHHHRVRYRWTALRRHPEIFRWH